MCVCGKGVANESMQQALWEVSAVVVGPPHAVGVHEIGVPLPPTQAPNRLQAAVPAHIHRSDCP